MLTNAYQMHNMLEERSIKLCLWEWDQYQVISGISRISYRFLFYVIVHGYTVDRSERCERRLDRVVVWSWVLPPLYVHIA